MRIRERRRERGKESEGEREGIDGAKDEREKRG